MNECWEDLDSKLGTRRIAGAKSRFPIRQKTHSQGHSEGALLKGEGGRGECVHGNVYTLWFARFALLCFVCSVWNVIFFPAMFVCSRFEKI